MSYTALYRKWRPDNFEDVKGQDHIVTTLKNQIKSDRVGHAYLFCGTRGTGKTSIAKIFAKAVNCEHPVEGSPCGECASCKTIATGASMNVIEIDAASNNGVDDIRELRDEVAYSPAEGKYKVYIIDEVHMLSISAFNALLKTLEEPPSYVIFILATTEVHKIPITILSRCQRYDFRRISVDTIADRMRPLLADENVQVEERALRFIAKMGDGSMRDAISLLDQCIAFHFGEELTYDKALEVLGAVDTEVYSRLLRIVMQKDITASIHLLEEITIQGRELTQFVIDFTWYLRHLLLVKTSDNVEDVLDVSSEHLGRLKEEADLIEQEALMRYIRIFSDLSGQIKYASQKRILTEMALIRLCKPSMETDQDSLLERIRDLEERMDQGIPAAMISAQTNTVKITAGSMAAPIQKPELPKAIPDDIRKAVEMWAAIVGEMSGLYKSYLKTAKLSMKEEGILLIVVGDVNVSKLLNREEHREKIMDIISERVGKKIEIEICGLESHQNFEQSYADLSKVINIEIEIED